MRILLTRPQERIEPLRSKLIDLGHEVVSQPLFQIIPTEFEPFQSQNYAGIIISSVFAAEYARLASLPIFGVGESLAEIFPSARLFSCIEELKKALDPGSHYLYLRGEKVTDELHDFSHDARIAYKTKIISAPLYDLKMIESVFLFSSHTAELFESLLQHSNQSCDHLEIFTLSSTIARSLRKNYKKIHIANTPTLDGMLQKLMKR